MYYILIKITTITEIYTLSLHDALPISSEQTATRRSLVTANAVGRRPLRSAIAPTRAPSDRKSTRLNSSHVESSYAVFCLKKKIRPLPKKQQKYLDRKSTRLNSSHVRIS